jgi:hypothetical protein
MTIQLSDLFPKEINCLQRWIWFNTLPEILCDLKTTEVKLLENAPPWVIEESYPSKIAETVISLEQGWIALFTMILKEINRT